MADSSAKPRPAGDAHPPSPGGKSPWEAPRLTELPRLTDLTLLTGSGIIGGGSGSSTVF